MAEEPKMSAVEKLAATLSSGHLASSKINSRESSSEGEPQPDFGEVVQSPLNLEDKKSQDKDRPNNLKGLEVQALDES